VGDNAEANPSRGHYEWDLDIQVETCIQEYEEDMKKWYSEGGPTDPELATTIFEQAERYADHVLKATEDLVPPQPAESTLVEPELRRFIGRFESNLAACAAILEQKGLSADGFLSALRGTISDTRPDDGTILKVVWELLLATSMWDSVYRSRKAATRLLLLSDLRVPSTPTKRTRAFLRQVAECFALGLDVPCIVFCRSAIDVALEDAGFVKRGLKDRIKQAGKAGRLDVDGTESATKVKELGDDAVHGAPLAMADVLDVIRKTLLVLQQLTQPQAA